MGALLVEGDEIRIRSIFIPPCVAGVKPVHSKFVEYIRQNENRFTITQVGKVPGMLSVFEVSLLLEERQVEKVGGKFFVVNVGR